MKLIDIIFWFLVLWLCINLYLLIKVKRLRNLYMAFFTQESSKALRCKKEIIDIFKIAGLKSSEIGFAQPVGYNMIESGDAKVWSNMFVNDKRIVRAVLDDFEEANGIFASRLRNTLNPFYWLLRIILLPKYIITYLGIKTDTFITKLVQLIYWVWVVFYAIYNSQVNAFIQSLISKVFN